MAIFICRSLYTVLFKALCCLLARPFLEPFARYLQGTLQLLHLSSALSSARVLLRQHCEIEPHSKYSSCLLVAKIAPGLSLFLPCKDADGMASFTTVIHAYELVNVCKIFDMRHITPLCHVMCYFFNLPPERRA